MFPTSIFRSNDIRGVYPDDLTEDVAYAVGRVAPEILDAKRVFLARDGRTSSLSLRQALVDGLLDAGIDVVDGGLMDTCQFYFSVEKGELDAGFMVTASHNPKEYNGIKITRKRARPITIKGDLAVIRDAAASFEYTPVTAAERGSLGVDSFALDYLKFIRSKVDMKCMKPLRIVVDGSHGMGSLFVQEVFSDLPFEVRFINSFADGNFPAHSPNPQGAHSFDRLTQEVTVNKADLGIMFDGDADRVMFCDENGEVLRGDVTLSILARAYIDQHPGATVTCDLRSSDYVHDVVHEAGGEITETPVGHGKIKTFLVEHDLPFGGELSGHYYFNFDGFVVDNTWIAILLVLQKLCTSDCKLSELVDGYKEYHTLSEKNYTDVDGDVVVERVRQMYEDEALESTDLDGLALRFTDWRMNLRKSGTEPLVRLMIESRSKDVLDEKLAEIEKLILQK